MGQVGHMNFIHPFRIQILGAAEVAYLGALPVSDLPPSIDRLFTAELVAIVVANGESDRMVPTTNSLDLAQRLPNADLVIYPDAGHGGIFQFHDAFAPLAVAFLDR